MHVSAGGLRHYGAVQTERLNLEPITSDDVDALAVVFAKPEVWHFPFGRAFDHEDTARFVANQVRNWEQDGFGLWTVRLREVDTVLGFLGLAVPRFAPEVLPAVEVGWRLDPAHWGRGLATEGARAALAEGFGILGLERIISLVDDGNERSQRVCGRLGMRFERALTRKATPERGELHTLLYSLGRQEWQTQPLPPAQTR